MMRARPSCLIVALWAACVCCVAGCDKDQKVPTDYGSVGGGKTPSLNGVNVLAAMFEQAGHDVTTARELSDVKEKNIDVIVWAPDDYDSPDFPAEHNLNDWLNAAAGRTLIFIGRDYDAEPTYWEKIRAQAPANQIAEINVRLAEARQRVAASRTQAPQRVECSWFHLEAETRMAPIHSLTGPWSIGVDPAKTDIELGTRLRPTPGSHILLQSDAGPVVFIERTAGAFYTAGGDSDDPDPDDTPSSDDARGPAESTAPPEFGPAELDSSGMHQASHSHVIVVANGSFLLNLPLVNREHRKLAAKLIYATPAKSRVMFLVSGRGGPPVYDNSEQPPQNENPSKSPFSLFTMWPLNWIFVHLAALGLIYLFFCWPIFGVPRDPPAESTANFAKHISALGGLLSVTGDRDYALQRLNYYQQNVRGDASGARGKTGTKGNFHA